MRDKNDTSALAAALESPSTSPKTDLNDDNSNNHILSAIADSTFLNRGDGIFNNNLSDDADDEYDDNIEFISLVGSSQRIQKRRKKIRQYFRKHQDENKHVPIRRLVPSYFQPKKTPPLRAILLAVSLSLILAAFWILDSLKDPIFTVLVGGELGKHQPRAKMLSVGITLLLVCTVEFISHARTKNRKQQEALRNRSDEDVLDAGGKWTKMSVGTSFEQPAEETMQKRDDAAIPVAIFTALGLCYAKLFAAIAYSLSRHPAFRDEEMTEATSPSAAWRTLGYAVYAAVESYGSLTVAAFWSFSNSNLTLQTAEENYGLIIAAAQLGAIGGSTIVAMARSSIAATPIHNKWYQWGYWGLKKQMSVPALVLLGCGLMLLQVLLMNIYSRLFPVSMIEESIMNGGVDDDEEDYRPVITKPNAASFHPQSPSHGDVPEFASKSKKELRKELSNSGGEAGDGLGACMSGVFVILRYNYVLLILGVSCLFEVSLTCLDYEMKLLGLNKFGGADELPSPHITAGDITEFDGGEEYYKGYGGQYEEHADDIHEENTTTFAQFMGRYGQMTNIISLLLSYFAFPYLMTHYGLRSTLRLFPALLVFVTILAYLAVPFNLPVLFVSVSLLKAMTYSINDPAKELLYMPTSNTVKFKAKFWIDVVGARIAKAVGSSINNYAGSVERIVRYGAIPSLLTAVGLYVICLKAGEQFESLIQRGEIVGWEEDEDGDDDEIQGNGVGGRSYSRHDDDDDNNDDNNDLSIAQSFSEDTDDVWVSDTTIELVKR